MELVEKVGRSRWTSGGSGLEIQSKIQKGEGA